MKQTIISMTSAGESDFKCIDRRGNAGGEYLVIIDMEEGQGTATFQFTPDDCIDGTTELWIDHDVLSGVTASCASTITVPFQAFRLVVDNYGSGTIKARVVQGGYHDF